MIHAGKLEELPDIALDFSDMEDSRAQTDRLGRRLRMGAITSDDLRALAEYRASFDGAYRRVIDVLRDRLSVSVTGRPAKSTSAILEKLHRESIRLSQMQDIAGCRIVVANLEAQDRVALDIQQLFTSAKSIDRRSRPSHGYRAVHVLVRVGDRHVEVQLRTRLQHAWSELSEKLADTVDKDVKYGGGPPNVRNLLSSASALVYDVEQKSALLRRLRIQAATLQAQVDVLRTQKPLLEQVGLSTDDLPDAHDLLRDVDSVAAELGESEFTLVNLFSQFITET